VEVVRWAKCLQCNRSAAAARARATVPLASDQLTYSSRSSSPVRVQTRRPMTQSAEDSARAASPASAGWSAVSMLRGLNTSPTVRALSAIWLSSASASGRCCSAARRFGRARRRQPIQSHKLRQSREASARCIMTPIARAGQSATLGLRRREGWRSTASFVWSMCSSGIGTTQRKCGRRTSAVGFVSSSSATSYLFIHTRGGIKMRPGVKDELFRLQDLASLRSQMLKLSSPMADRRLALVGCHQSMPTRRTPIDRG